VASRNTPARLIPGEPLLSLLRWQAYETRRTTRRSTATGVADGETSDGAAATGGAAGGARATSLLATATLTSGVSGTVVWNYGPFTTTPTITVTVLSATARFSTVSPIGVGSATISVWDAAGAAVSGVQVQVAAFGAP
jgi:hypothetical protein